MDQINEASEIISLFCRLNLNIKRELPIRASEMGMLIFIVKSDEPLMSSKVADFFKVSKPMVTAMTNSLVKHGYIKKIPSETDKRSALLIPTDKGIQLVEETNSEYTKNMTRLREVLGQEKFSVLLQLIDEANRILEEKI